MENIFKLYEKYKGIIAYLFFGVCTTLMNIVVYYVCAHVAGFGTIFSTIIAWIVAVVFAYITNKLWVFECKSWKYDVVIKEASSFFMCRVLTGILDVAIMTIFVDLLLLNDMVVKIVSNVIVIILNYFASKIIVFKKELK